MSKASYYEGKISIWEETKCSLSHSLVRKIKLFQHFRESSFIRLRLLLSLLNKEHDRNRAMFLCPTKNWREKIRSSTPRQMLNPPKLEIRTCFPAKGKLLQTWVNCYNRYWNLFRSDRSWTGEDYISHLLNAMSILKGSGDIKPSAFLNGSTKSCPELKFK